MSGGNVISRQQPSQHVVITTPKKPGKQQQTNKQTNKQTQTFYVILLEFGDKQESEVAKTDKVAYLKGHQLVSSPGQQILVAQPGQKQGDGQQYQVNSKHKHKQIYTFTHLSSHSKQ